MQSITLGQESFLHSSLANLDMLLLASIIVNGTSRSTLFAANTLLPKSLSKNEITFQSLFLPPARMLIIPYLPFQQFALEELQP